MWIQTAGIMQGLGMDPERWREALRKLDFAVAVDLFHTATTQYADVTIHRRDIENNCQALFNDSPPGSKREDE
jgi:hypothetical protein